ncbi:MAG: asparagine synthase (glutamine-hydrolyzing) [Lachnospiraceae bacterium]|nr:asparagine synthase (glutamine-hydrolyzing) [Lachnospiraceae bacterium]
MCGICGFVSKQHISPEQLAAMNDTMIHRGPDDAGVEVTPLQDGYQLGMAQRRLAIIDLSPLGHQPMSTPDGLVTIVFNGEIYNFLELKKELTDYPFRGGSDTEVILAAYLKWGAECVSRLNGMFAIALYDHRSQELLLMRDRIGKKPLYYWAQDGNLVFASELKPLMCCPGFPRAIRKEVLSRYLFQQYINAPETIFHNVFKLEPGSVLRFHAGDISCRKYWDLAQVYHEKAGDPVSSYEEAKSGLKQQLVRATGLRMIADVPLGAFLSGGYDSSLVSAIAQAQLGSEPLKTFSIGFTNEAYNEAGYARAVAEYLGTEHTEEIISEDEMFELVESIPKYFDEPFADSSQIPTMLVSMLAKRRVTVALSGDGGDEFYCGYGIYDNVRQAQRLDAAGAIAHGIGQLKLGGRTLESRYPFRVRVISGNRNPETKTQFGAGSYVDYALQMISDPDSTRTLPVNYPIESRYGVEDWQIRRMLLDMDTYLPGDILCKVDRASMKYSLEARCPILDPAVMEYSFRIPHEFKYRDGEKNAILKDIAYDYIPRDLLERPKKGFSVPLDQWLRGPLREQLTDYIDRDRLMRQGLFDADFTIRFVQDYLEKGDGGPATGANYSKLTWSFFVFQQWYEAYLSNG